ncbi:hypothetical protein [Bradyrhizobium prioriisuperbiae]|uniref:hypothetical protein n=1 Tax=Bradyrhizobium prioriisuperbiae TaxID=2854389 RepID=UPI0028EA8A41|nr:hypothetical protein [Bradyrhizobium prioritasuperba]
MSSLDSKVLQVLNGPTVARIRFRFPIAGSHVTIAPQTFHHVARAIQSGRVIVRRPTDLAAGVAAQYNDVARTRANGTVVRANTIEVASALGRLDEANIVHESLHAAYDLLRTGLDGNAEEASAYVCTALYCRMTGLPRPRWANGQIFANAELTARTLLSQYQRGDPGIPWVGNAEWRMLRAGVGLHPIYATGGGPAGIVTGWLLGQQYTHDG